MTSVLAIVCVRNESMHIRRCLRDFIDDGIDVILIDNDSTDDTVEKARAFLGRGLRSIERLPWYGAFSLSEQLAFKAKIANNVAYDWIIHADADEWLSPPAGGGTLLQAIDAAQAAGYNCINFREFVFAAKPGENFEDENYAAKMLAYYLFEPTHPRLMRAWRRDCGLHHGDGGGHTLAGAPLHLAPEDFILRHYVMLSEDHGRRKYVGRRFASADREKGWHGNRVAISADNLRMRFRPEIRYLPDASSREFDTSAPLRTHFWEWT